MSRASKPVPPQESSAVDPPRSPRRGLGLLTGAAVTTGIAVYDLLAPASWETYAVLAIGPCLAAASASPQVVAALGCYTTLLVGALAMSNDRMTSGQVLLRLSSIMAITGVSMWIAHRRQSIERRAAQGKANSRQLAAIVQSSDDAIIAGDRHGRVISWNPGAQRLYGYTEDEALGQTIALVAPAGQADAMRQVVADALLGEHIDGYETRHRRKDGTIVDVSLRVAPIYDEAGAVVGVSGISRDITFRVAAEARERLAQQRSQASQRLESLGQLAGGIAHDFNNQLAVILNYASFIADEAPTDTPVHADATKIHDAAVRAATLTDQLKVFARGEPAKVQVFDLNGTLTDVQHLLLRTLGVHIKTVVTPAPEPLPVNADRGRIQQVLLDLSVNARDAMPDGGTLVIEAAATDVDDQALSWTGITPGRYALLQVSDTGAGMTPEVADRAFEPFFTTKPKGQGTGLGLSSVYGTVTEAGGAVKIYSQPQVGTTIRVYLPLCEQPATAPAPPAATPSTAPGGRGEHVLVAEDEPAIRQLVQRILTSHGYTVTVAGNGPEAIRLADKTHIDLLLTDMIMPEMTGRALADALHSDHPDLPVLFMSGYSDGLLTAQHLLRDNIALLTKPFTTRELLCAVNAMISPSLSTPRCD